MWLNQAKSLQEGWNTRIVCPYCSGVSSTPARIEHKPLGYSFYCFSCKTTKWKSKGLQPISKLKLFETEKFRKGSMKLPHDFTLEIPQAEAVWLYKSGIYKETYEAYGIGWSPSLQRIILPVYKDGELVYMQSRIQHPTVLQPKYLNRTATNKADVMFVAKNGEYQSGYNIIVMTEAILSAIRVGVYYKCISTLGSSLTDSVAYQLSTKKVLIWYDPDKAGWSGSLEAYKKLKSLGTEVKIIGTELKPKQYNNEEIQRIVWESLNRV